MGQRAVESLLGRLITDRQFRRRFYEDPAALCISEQLLVTPRELEAVLSLDERRIVEFARHVDVKIVRAVVEPEGRMRQPVAGIVPSRRRGASG